LESSIIWFPISNRQDRTCFVAKKWRYDDIINDDPGKHLLIGFDNNEYY